MKNKNLNNKNVNNLNTRPYEKKNKFFKSLSKVKKNNMQTILLLSFAFLSVIFSFILNVWCGISLLFISLLLVYVIKCPVDNKKTIEDLKKIEEKQKKKKRC